MNATVQLHHARPFAALFSELAGAVESLPEAVDAIGTLAADRDSLALERLERLGERLTGLQRQTMLARAALMRDMQPSTPEAA